MSELLKTSSNGQWELLEKATMPIADEKKSKKKEVDGKPYDGSERHEKEPEKKITKGEKERQDNKGGEFLKFSPGSQWSMCKTK